MFRDLRYAARSLRRSQVFAATTTLTLALGVGANTAIFSVVKAALLNAPPWNEPERVAELDLLGPRFRLPFNKSELRSFRGALSSFERIEGFRRQNEAVVAGEGDSLLLGSAGISPGLMPMLGVQPIAGRGFVEADSRPAGDRVAMISERLWRNGFGADPDLVGRRLQIADGRYTEGSHAIIGVMPEGFAFPDQTVDVWVPIVINPADESDFTERSANIQLLGRLAPSATVEGASAEATALLRATSDSPSIHDYGIRVTAYRDLQVQDFRTNLLLLTGAVGFLLLIAAVNVSNLLIARLDTRRSEMATRAALGASGWQLARGALSESLLIGVAGCVVGYVMAQWSVGLIVATMPEGFSGVANVRLDGSIFAFCLIASLATSTVAALFPALRAHRTAPFENIRPASTGAGGLASRRPLVVFELALIVPLIVASALMLKSVWLLQAREPGIDPADVVTFRLDARDGDMARLNAYYEQVLSDVRQLPGVASASVVRSLPFIIGSSNTNATFPHDPSIADGRGDLIAYQVVHSGYFETLGIALLSGRDFSPADTEGAPQVAIVNRALADRYFGGRNPIGERINIGDEREIVGVVENTRERGLATEAQPQVYPPYGQVFNARGTRNLLVRFAGRRATLDNVVTQVRRTVTAIDPGVAVSEVRTMSDVLSASLAVELGMSRLLSLFAALALALGAVGLYGIMAYLVEQRSREFAIRAALGARGAELLTSVLREGAALVLTGLTLGLAAATGLGNLMSGLLFEVPAHDPATLITTCMVLFAVGLVAIVVPCRKAIRTDPIAILKS